MPTYLFELLRLNPRDFAAISSEEINKPSRLIEHTARDREVMLGEFCVTNRLEYLAADVVPAADCYLESPVVAKPTIAETAANRALEDRRLGLTYSCFASAASAPSAESPVSEEGADTYFFLASGESAAPSRTA